MTIGLKVNDLKITYKSGHCAIYNTSFELVKGSITALIGVNGSGKSTLFKALMGLVELDSGAIKIWGMPVSKALKSNIVAYVPQGQEIDWNFPISVKEVVMMGRYSHMNFFRFERAIDKKIVNEALLKMDLFEYSDMPICELSIGQQKKVFIARALAQEPDVILLDEPFSGIDVPTQEQVISILKELRADGKLVLLSTHNLNCIRELCDQSILINRTVLAEGKTQIVFTKNNLHKTFGKILRNVDHVNEPYGEILSADEMAALFDSFGFDEEAQ